MIVERRTEIGASAEALFAWHARPGAFERLVPPWEEVRLLEPHRGLTNGSRVRFEIRVGPLWRTWVARHEAVAPGLGFTDVQETGPFARWRHQHRFESLGPERSTLIDTIDCDLPGGPLGELFDPLVRRSIRRALRYRHGVTAGDIALHAASADSPRLTVAISGASGMIGSALSALLTTGGHRVIPLVRHPPGPGEVRWDPESETLDPADLAGVDAVVHLAGESIAGQRWNPARKARILESRIKGTRTIARAVAAASPRPRVMVSASAIGFYGDRGDLVLDEDAASGSGFLAEVVRDWEAATEPAAAAGVRTVSTRFGIILTPAGGALEKMLPPFRFGLGAPLGSGRQWMSWVSLDDCVGAIAHLLTHEVSGPVNVVAPEPVSNAAFTGLLGDALHRPTILPAVPAFALRLLVGEIADEALLSSARVASTRLEETGYRFRHRSLPEALGHVLGTGS